MRTVASICLSSTVGRWVDRSPNRLKTLQTTISVNRLTVIAASVLWFFIVDASQDQHHDPTTQSPRSNIFDLEASAALKAGLFVIILALGIFENQSASGNMLSMERDWVVIVADRDGMPYDLTHLNSSMRRIDLICKLVAPILISLIVSATSTRIGVLAVGGMSLASWGVEVFCARRVWTRNAKLRAPKPVPEQEQEAVATDAPRPSFAAKILAGLMQYWKGFEIYFSSPAWIPSLSLALLHLSALSYGATFITYLLSVGISLSAITMARAAGSIVEISSTVVTPIGVSILGKAINHGKYRGLERANEESATALLDGEAVQQEGSTETGLQRLGLWGLSWQLFNLVRPFPSPSHQHTNKTQVPVVYALYSFSPTPLANIIPSPLITTVVLFTFLSLSRLGLWVFDLTTQQLTQTLTIPSQRSSFAGVEYSFVALFELLQHVCTIILHRPDQFRWLAAGSCCAVAVSSVAYSGWVRGRRGHLVHWERCVGCGKGERG